MADEKEKPKKLTLKEIAERAAKTQPQLSPGAPVRLTYPPGEGRGSAPPNSQPPTSSPPGSLPPPSARGSAPPSAAPSGAPSAPPASQAPASLPPPSEVASARTSAPPAPPVNAAVAKPAAPPAKKGDEPASPLPFLVAGIVLVSLLAIGYAVMKRPQGPTAQFPPPEPTMSAPPAVMSSAATVASTAPVASAGAMDINNLGAVDPAGKEVKAGPKDLKDPKDSKKPDTAAPTATSAAPIGPAGELSDEIKKRMGGSGGKAETGDPSGTPSDAKESKPSPGAVAGALNAIRGAARSCLADTEDVARINIVFGSSGAAQSATVTGAGKAEACVRAAVMKAKVAPFTDASFSTSFTVRP